MIWYDDGERLQEFTYKRPYFHMITATHDILKCKATMPMKCTRFPAANRGNYSGSVNSLRLTASGDYVMIGKRVGCHGASYEETSCCKKTIAKCPGSGEGDCEPIANGCNPRIYMEPNGEWIYRWNYGEILKCPVDPTVDNVCLESPGDAKAWKSPYYSAPYGKGTVDMQGANNGVVEVDEKGDFIFLIRWKSCVEKCPADGSDCEADVAGKCGSKGNTQDRLSRSYYSGGGPIGMSLTQDGHYLISDSGNCRVQKCNPRNHQCTTVVTGESCSRSAYYPQHTIEVDPVSSCGPACQDGSSWQKKCKRLYCSFCSQCDGLDLN